MGIFFPNSWKIDGNTHIFPTHGFLEIFPVLVNLFAHEFRVEVLLLDALPNSNPLTSQIKLVVFTRDTISLEIRIFISRYYARCVATNKDALYICRGQDIIALLALPCLSETVFQQVQLGHLG